MDVAIVVPTIREDSIEEFLDAWRFDQTDAAVYIVEDNPTATFDLGRDCGHFSWRDIKSDLGENEWIISRRSAAIRCYGFLRAYWDGADVIITLDDDCLPLRYPDNPAPSFIATHLSMLAKKHPRWVSTIDSVYQARGEPYRDRGAIHTVLNMGGWTNVPDLDALTELVSGGARDIPMQTLEPVPLGMYCPVCSMNLAFKREAMPLMYFPLMSQDCQGEAWPFDRFDDIWCGVLAKKVCDHLHWAISAGRPLVKHTRASNVWNNLRKETSALEVNEKFWQWIDSVILTADDAGGCYAQLADFVRHQVGVLDSRHSDYWHSLGVAMEIWLESTDR